MEDLECDPKSHPFFLLFFRQSFFPLKPKAAFSSPVTSTLFFSKKVCLNGRPFFCFNVPSALVFVLSGCRETETPPFFFFRNRWNGLFSFFRPLPPKGPKCATRHSSSIVKYSAVFFLFLGKNWWGNVLSSLFFFFQGPFPSFLHFGAGRGVSFPFFFSRQHGANAFFQVGGDGFFSFFFILRSFFPKGGAVLAGGKGGGLFLHGEHSAFSFLFLWLDSFRLKPMMTPLEMAGYRPFFFFFFLRKAELVLIFFLFFFFWQCFSPFSSPYRFGRVRATSFRRLWGRVPLSSLYGEAPLLSPSLFSGNGGRIISFLSSRKHPFSRDGGEKLFLRCKPRFLSGNRETMDLLLRLFPSF